MQSLAVTDTLYILMGGGTSTLALMRDEGTVLIDPKPPGWGQSIVNAINAVTEEPVRTIINTHPNSAGSNFEFTAVTQIIAHENAKSRMEKMDVFQGPNAKYLPNKTVTNRMSLLEGVDRIELYYFGAAYTDGDLIVVFPEKKVAYLGQLFPSKAAPRIDTAHGGSGVVFPRTLARVVTEITGISRVITGDDLGVLPPRGNPGSALLSVNARTMTWLDLQEYAAFMRDFVDAVQDAVKAGMSADDAARKLVLPDRYKDYDMKRAADDVHAIYTELKR
jgi:hypothetical protein